MCARSQTSGDISGECWCTSSASPTQPVRPLVLALASNSLLAIWLRSASASAAMVMPVPLARFGRYGAVVEHVIGWAAAAVHVAFGERGYGVRDGRRCPRPGERRSCYLEAAARGPGQARVGQAVPGR